MATSFNFGETVSLMQDTGVYAYLLPFLLIFAIVFALLEKTKVLGDDKTNINALVSIIIGLILIVQQGIVEIINRFLPRVSLILVVILMALVVIATIAGKKFSGFQGAWLGFFIFVGMAAIIYALAAGTGGSNFLSSKDKEMLITIGVPVIVIALAFWFVTRHKKDSKKPGSMKTFLKGLADDLKDE